MRIIRICEDLILKKLKLFSAIFLLVALISGAVFSLLYFTKKDVNAKVVTTIFPLYDICREIMGSDDDIMLLQDNGADMHSYTATASDIAAISNAELFLYVGGESDEWISDVMRSIDNVNLKTLSLMELENITKLEENMDNILEDVHHDHEHDHDHEEIIYDEHIWLSLRNVINMIDPIVESLTKVFPERQELFRTNAERYLSELISLENDYSSSINNASQTLIIADRFPFRYLVNDYNLKSYAIFSGCSAESEASTETIATLIDKINDNAVEYVLVLETSDQSIARSCVSNHNCREGVSILVINSCQAISQSTMQTSSYLDIMAKNLDVLKKAVGV